MSPVAAPPKSPRKLRSPQKTFQALWRFDQQARATWADREPEQPFLLIGADEVGRGSLIGPVVAAAVAFPPSLTPAQRKALAALNDSKQLSAAQRAQLYDTLHAHAYVAIAQADREEVDTLNIHHASLLALSRAVDALIAQWPLLCDTPPALLLDGRWLLPDHPPAHQRAVVKGDAQSACIAAASVVAKHWRDSLVIQLAEDYPDYGWDTNMGYGTPAHKAALARLGPTPHHRLSFTWD